MREIKFRQRIGDRWHYWGFIDGQFISPATSDNEVEESQYQSQQFTGLYDNKGNEVYEGDIVRRFDVGVYGEEWCNPYIGVIDYHEGKMTFYVRAVSPRTRGYYTMESMEVIGNIYEHAHLLNDKT